MSKQKTAVDWLKDKINSNLSAPMSIKFQEMFEQAKELEKQQIIESGKHCRKYPHIKRGEVYYEVIAKQYYSDTYE